MNISYKSSQAKSDFKHAQHNRIPLEQVQENTTSLLNFIDTYEFSDTNAIEYIVKITELLKDGAKITALAHNNILLNITKYFFDIEQSTNMNDVENDKIFDPYFNLLLEISKSNDDDCMICAQNSNFPNFLELILKESNLFHIVASIIDIILNFAYEKPKTANFFNYDFLLKYLYDTYNRFFFMSRYDKVTGSDNVSQLQYIISPSFELVLVLLISNPTKTDLLDKYVPQLAVTVSSVLDKKRSENNDSVYRWQVKMTLTQLNYVFLHSDSLIVDGFCTFNIVQAVLNCINAGGKITLLALNCLKQIATYFAAAFLIVRTDTFNNFRPEKKDYQNQEKYLDTIKVYCQVWMNIVKSITIADGPSNGRIQSAQSSLQNYAPDFLKFLQTVNDIKDDFDYQKIISLTFITFAFFNDDNTLNQVVTYCEDIIQRIARIIEERNPDDVRVISTALINIIQHYFNSGRKYALIADDLSTCQQDIKDGLSEIRDLMIEDYGRDQIDGLEQNINQIEQLFSQV